MQPGTRLDHYEIVSLLGEGGMGAVYRAEDTRLKRQVAIKVLPPELAADPERLARLEREAQLLASLNHPNVATVHGFGDVTTEVDGQQQRVTFLVMELVQGESLYDRAKMGPMPWREVVQIGIGIAAGLEAAHERGIVHRDLKPANVHLATDGTVKVLDFGLAKAFEGEGASGSLELSASPTMAAATRTGVILGTAAYMSPEQARGQVVDKRADIWALGCLLYELLGGRKTFDGGTVSDILASILKEAPDFDALPPIPASLRHVLARCLEKDPARRLRDVGDLRLDLEAARTERAAARAETTGRAGASWKLVTGMAAVMLVLGLAAGYPLWSRTDVAPEAQVIISPDSVAAGFQPLAISPDGRWIAEARIGANGAIRLRAMNEIGWRELADTAGTLSIAFSADSQRLYFTRGGQDRVGLFRIDVFGTAPVLEGTASSGAEVGLVFRGIEGRMVITSTPFAGGSYTISQLNPDGTIDELLAGESEGSAYYFSTQVSATAWLGFEGTGASAVGLLFLNGATGDVVRLLAGHSSPLYLGDGRLLAVDERGLLVSARIDPATGAIVEPPVVRTEGVGRWIGLSAAYAIADTGTLVYVQGNNETRQQILSWLLPSGAVEPLTQRLGEYEIDSRVSPDGRYLAMETAGDQPSIAIHDIARDVRTALVPGADVGFPVWSPDGSYVAYELADGEKPGIYLTPVDRSEAPEMLQAYPEDGFALPTDWASDGRYLLYVDSTSATRAPGAERNDLWLLPLDGSEPQPFLATEASEIDGRFSPDARWVAYVSSQSGGYEVYVRALDGGGEFQISADGGTSPEWNPAGGQIFFQKGGAIYAVDIDVTGATPIVSPERLLVEFPAELRRNLWSPAPAGDRFLVAQFEDGEVNTRSVRAIFNWDVLRDWR